MDRFSISLKKEPPPDNRTDIQKMIQGESVAFTANDLSKMIFSGQDKIFNIIFKGMSVETRKATMEEKLIVEVSIINGNQVVVKDLLQKSSSDVPLKNARYKMIHKK